MSRPATETHSCKCGCGTEIPASSTWARGHWARKQAADRLKLAPLPGPDVADDDLELHLDLPELDDAPPPRPGPEPREFVSGPQGDTEEIVEEARPIGWPPAGGGQRRTGGRTVNVSAKVRKDINAKLRLMLMIPGKLWEIRDPWCGGAFVQQEPEIADALADIVCDSADLVAFFTGPAGGFMKYLNLLNAMQPVAWAVWAHHISHSVGQDATISQQQPDMARYAA